MHMLAARRLSAAAVGATSVLEARRRDAACCPKLGITLLAKRRLTLGSLEGEVVVLERQQGNGAPLVRVPLKRMVEDLAHPRIRMVFFGETHDDPVAQAVEREVYAGVARRKPLALALEFVDGDARAAAASYSSGERDDVDALFTSPGDAARYGPLAELARGAGNAIVAALAPRRHAKLVAAEGPAALEALSAEDVELLPPLPYASKPLSPQYAAALKPFGFSEQKIAAQCLWDASMAHACLATLAADPKLAVMLVCGKFHVQHFLGVVDHVEHLTGDGGAFESTVSCDRDEWRVVVCLPLDEGEFARLRDETDAAGTLEDPSLDTVADFVVVTKAPRR